MAIELPNISANVRRDLELWDYNFQEPQDLTEEELGKKKVEEEKMKQEWLKKSKKKKWGEEEEKIAFQQCHDKLNQKTTEYFMEILDNFDTNAQYSKAICLMQNEQRTNYKYFTKLFRTKPLVDMDLDGRRIMLRVHFRLIKQTNAQEIKLQHEENIIKQAEEEQKQEEMRQEALRQEQQKQKQRKGGKKQQQVVQVEEKKQERAFDMSFLDQQNLQDIIQTVKFCVEHLAKLVIIVPSYDRPTGVFREMSSMRFFVDYLQTIFPETIINYNESGYLIDDFADKMENDFYPENSLLILENIFFQKEETGMLIDENNNIETLTYAEKLPFIRTITEYSPLYVIEDKFNFLNSTVSTLKYVRPENVVLGVGMAEDMKALSYWFQVMKGTNAPSVAIVGGELQLIKLLAIDTLVQFCKVIWITGKLALYFILVKKEENNLFNVMIDQKNQKLKELISKIFEKARKNNVEIKLPEDVQVCTKQENFNLYTIDGQQYINENIKVFKTLGPPKEMVDKYMHQLEIIRQQEEQEQLLKEQQQKDQKKGGKDLKQQQEQKKDTKQDKDKDKEKDKQPQDKPLQTEKKRLEIAGWNELPLEHQQYNLLDWGPMTHQSLMNTLSSQFKLFWIDSISPDPHNFPSIFNQSNKQIGTFLMQLQQKQRKCIQLDQLAHLFSADSFVTLFGNDLCEFLNGFELITEEEEQRRKELEEKKRRQQEVQEDADEDQQLDEEDRRSQGSQGTHVLQVEKRNNAALIADFVGKDSEFACALLTGQYLPVLNNIDIYDRTEESQVDEEFDFLLEN